MGNKPSSSGRSATLLNPNERRRLTVFLESKGGRTQFNREEMQRLWKDLLVPDLLASYTEFLMKQDSSNKKYIEVEQFVLIYSTLVRGAAEDKAACLAEIIGTQKNSSSHRIISFNTLLKYLSDLLESYFLGLKGKNDTNYKSWTHMKHPTRAVIEQVMTGVCSEIPRKNEEVEVHDLERWLNYTGVVSVLHSYVLGSLYDLEPEVKATIIPQAILPSTKSPTTLDLSQIVYLNDHLPSEHKINWRLLFSTATHGESFSKFIGCITNEGPVLFVVETANKCSFGGFISQNLIPGPRWVGSTQCFLFTLNPSVEIFPATGYNDHYVYMNMNQSSLPNGLGMGGQFNYWGLWIDSHFGDGECSESCTTYKNYKMLDSNKKFHITKLEVWGVGDPPPSAEERGERTLSEKPSILDKDVAASHILQMAGRKVYSEGLRDGSPPKE